ncbi:hypothetical protein VmeM32_00092 [Vibrio phage vB_VmeM-32]|nr:hypothetical protein VmeM32_00092 [Vibrio phage vB_VmeM-32]
MCETDKPVKFAVYKLTFIDRLSKKTPPYYYIGSKTNFRIVDGVIYTNRNKPYFGSSRYRGYRDICQNETPKLDILGYFESSKAMLEYEANEQIKVDAANNIEYFNLSIANTKSNYTMQGYGTYKHIQICGDER